MTVSQHNQHQGLSVCYCVCFRRKQEKSEEPEAEKSSGQEGDYDGSTEEEEEEDHTRPERSAPPKGDNRELTSSFIFTPVLIGLSRGSVTYMFVVMKTVNTQLKFILPRKSNKTLFSYGSATFKNFSQNVLG